MLYFLLALAVAMAASLDFVVVAVFDSPIEEDHSLGQDKQLCPYAPHFSYFSFDELPHRKKFDYLLLYPVVFFVPVGVQPPV